ncbi:hypothetical protein BCR33DRAFT_208236 [Rhizoclosmatium globosum]|uniref:Uncharacterized protein n=1 Tax=Rhizoclosmatium globosum TaxID=329046 RepID=A0A1Y2CCH5_9FUNG|nr:hypothetical protein BCR33DRAFT_208236 [Rhizoclosmatium globosum]|eukprot:ORY44749.1 hypothetical protein BCR33DRAFT_208236 [Rhizoclosmatium globosum]
MELYLKVRSNSSTEKRRDGIVKTESAFRAWQRQRQRQLRRQQWKQHQSREQWLGQQLRQRQRQQRQQRQRQRRQQRGQEQWRRPSFFGLFCWKEGESRWDFSAVGTPRKISAPFFSLARARAFANPECLPVLNSVPSNRRRYL